MVSILVNGGVLLAHRMPYFSVLGILKYDSLVGQLTNTSPTHMTILELQRSPYSISPSVFILLIVLIHIYPYSSVFICIPPPHHPQPSHHHHPYPIRPPPT